MLEMSLEGWVTVCLHFDDFIAYKRGEARKNVAKRIQSGVVTPGETQTLDFRSDEERQKDYVSRWAMIPLTRAIDTLVITLRDPTSEVSRLLKHVADHCDELDVVYIQKDAAMVPDTAPVVTVPITVPTQVQDRPAQSHPKVVGSPDRSVLPVGSYFSQF
jgi:hypothetical protein